MQNLSSIILVFDRLGAAHLGPYGGELAPTPTWNHLATESFLVEHLLVETPELEPLYDAYWQSCHPLCQPSASRVSLAEAVRGQGYKTLFVTDEPRIGEHRLVNDFDHSVLFEHNPVSNAAAIVEQCSVARFLSYLLEQVPTGDEPFVLWAHCRAMEGPWDAPLEFRQQFLDEDDPDPNESTQAPNMQLPVDYDPDQLLTMAAGYAAEVMALDMCLGMFLEALDQVIHPDRYLFQVTASRGFPLGEHLSVGRSGDATLYEELVHVPWLIRMPNKIGGATRSQALAQAADIGATLLDWTGAGLTRDHVGSQSQLPLVRGDTPITKQRAVSMVGSTRVLRTPSWMYHQVSLEGESADDIEPTAGAAGSTQLFTKPDDRWEFNDVLDRCPEIVEQMSDELKQFCNHAQSGQLDKLPTLPESLQQPHV